MKKLLLSLILLGFYTSVSFGAFDYTISDTYQILTLSLNSESLLVTGAGADAIDAFGESYVEVQGTDPLQHHVGGIYSLDLDDSSTMNFYDGEMGGFRIIDNATATESNRDIKGAIEKKAGTMRDRFT